MLPEDRRTQLDGIVQQMIDNNEPDSNIRFVVDDFKKKYASTPTATPTPQQTGGVAGVATGFAKSSAKLVKGLGTLGETVLNKIGKPLGFEQTSAYRDLKIEEPTGLAEKAGALAGDVAQFAIPGSRVGRATKALSFLPRVATRAAGDAAVQLTRTGGDLGEAGAAGGTSAAVQAVTAAAGPAMRLLGGIFKNSAGLVSGRGSDVIETILREPKAAQEGLRGAVSNTLKQDVQAIKKQVLSLGRQSQKNYQQALDDLPARLGRPANELVAGAKTSVKQGGEKVTLTMQGVKSKLTSLLRNHSVEVNPKKKELEFLGSTLRKSEENILREVFGTVNRWKDTTPAGLDRLAVKIGNYVKPGDQSKELNSILSSLKSGTRNYLGERIPQAKEMVSRYRTEQKFLTELSTFLGAKTSAVDDPVALKNMATKLGTLFTKNKELAREVLESLPGGSEILGRQAGRELTTPIARSGASIGSLVQSAIQTVVPPKLIGEIAAQSGIAAQKLQPVFSSLRGLEPIERGILLRMLLGSEKPD